MCESNNNKQTTEPEKQRIIQEDHAPHHLEPSIRTIMRNRIKEFIAKAYELQQKLDKLSPEVLNMTERQYRQKCDLGLQDYPY